MLNLVLNLQLQIECYFKKETAVAVADQWGTAEILGVPGENGQKEINGEGKGGSSVLCYTQSKLDVVAAGDNSGIKSMDKIMEHVHEQLTKATKQITLFLYFR